MKFRKADNRERESVCVWERGREEYSQEREREVD